MKIKKAIKKIVALGIGATMLGATLGAASAAMLDNYPAPFVTNGIFNGYIVTHSGDDALAAIDIATHIYAAGAGSTQVTVTGDAWKVGTSAKFLEMAGNTASTIEGENFRNITTYISDDELSGALAEGSYSTNEKAVKYNQYLYFDSADSSNEIVKYTENEDDETADFLYFEQGAAGADIARYKLEFTSQAESDVTDSTGTACTTGTYLDDFEDTQIKMMGKTYDVVMARRYATGYTHSIKLVLMGGAKKTTLALDESETLEVNGNSYDVSLDYVDSTYAKFTVEGEDTTKLKVGDTRTLSDGTEIGVTEILYQSFAGGVMKATFFIGADKIELKDSNVTSTSTNYGSVVVGSEDIDGTTVFITGTDDDSKFKLSTIEINMSAEDDYFVPAGGKLSEVIAAAGEEAEVLFGDFDVEYKGLTDETTHDIKLDSSTDRKYQLKFYDGDGDSVTLPLAYASNHYNISLGEENVGTTTKTFVFNETNKIYKNNYFVMTGGTASDGSAKSYVLQYKGADNTGKTSPKIKFKNLGNSETLEYSVPTSVSSSEITDIKLGGYTFKVNNASSAASDDFQVYVAMNGDGTMTGGNPTIVDKYGAQITLTDHTYHDNATVAATQDWIFVSIATPNGNDYDNYAPTAFTLNITSVAGPELRATEGGYTLVTPEGETEVKYGYTTMGGMLTFAEPSSAPDKFTYAYPENQRLPQVYLTSGATETATIGGNLVAVTVPLAATKRADEVSSLSAQNVIIVGGPCANPAAMEIMYDVAPDNCAQDFTPGEAIIKFYDNGDNVALIVAGYSVDDTRRAGKVLAEASKYALSGSEVVVKGTTFTDITVSTV